MSTSEEESGTRMRKQEQGGQQEGIKEMVDSPGEAALESEDYEFLYNILKGAHNVLLIGTSLRALEMYVKAVEMGFKSKFIFVEERDGKYKEHIQKANIPEWLQVPTLRRGPFHVSAELLVCSSSDLTLTQSGNSIDGCMEECNIRAFTTWNGKSGKNVPLTYRKEGGGEYNGWYILCLDSDVVSNNEMDREKGGKSQQYQHDWYKAIDRISSDNKNELDKFLPVCHILYREVFFLSVIQCVSFFLMIVTYIYSIPGGYWVRWPFDFYFYICGFKGTITQYNPTGVDFKSKMNVAIVLAITFATFLSGLGTIPIKVWYQCDDPGEYSVSQWCSPGCSDENKDCNEYNFYIGPFFCGAFASTCHFVVATLYCIYLHGFAGPRFIWTVLNFVSMVGSFILIPILLAVGDFIKNSGGGMWSGIYISAIFAMLEPSLNFIFGWCYDRLIYKGNEITTKDKYGADIKEGQRDFVPGPQKRTMVMAISLFHSWCETARIVGLLCKTIRDPTDGSYLASLIFSCVLNISSRANYTACVLIRILPTPFLKSCLLPSLWTYLHKDAKFAIGWHRFGVFLGIIFARLVYFSTSSTTDDPEGLLHQAFWNWSTFYCFLVALLCEAVEDGATMLFINLPKTHFFSPTRIMHAASASTFQWLKDTDPDYLDKFNPNVTYDDAPLNNKEGEKAEIINYAPCFRSSLRKTFSMLDLFLIPISTGTLMLSLFVLGIGKDAFLGIAPLAEPYYLKRLLDVFAWEDHTLL